MDSAPPPPAQVTYGEGMADALKAQAEFLRGTGDFAGVGSLESLLPLEESIRKKTAQTDTDILRTTLLGTGETQIADEQGRVVKGETKPPQGALTIRNTDDIYKQYVLNNLDVHSQFEDQVPAHIRERLAENPDDEEAKMLAAMQFSGMGAAMSGKEPNISEYGKRHYEKYGAAQGRVLPEIGKTYLPDGTEFTPEPIMSDPGTYEPGEEVKPSGMIDLLGDTREMTQYETRTATQEDVDAGLAEEVGDSFVQSTQTEDQAGYRDGRFKGLSTMAEDIQRGSLSRQREADLQDVSRLSGLYGEIMEDYKPGTTSAMQGAKDLIEEQKDNLMRDVGISDPAQVASQGVQADPLRQGLMTQAEQALGQGLTDREERQIAEAARARSTMMGRTFDQSGTIAEAEARVLEDNQRKMQNRAFAQQVLGQEAGIQTADDTRAMGADQFNVGSKMDAERLRESLRQQGLLGYLDAASRISQIENQDKLDPFQAILGRGGGTALQQGQSVFGQAGYGLQSQPQYLRPEAGLGFIQNQATNAANMYGAQVGSDATKMAGIFSGLGALGGGLGGGLLARSCWVAREVYGLHNPAWIAFREWMLNDSPSWFRTIYIRFGERFAKFISNKPRLKARIRMWMDTKIGR